jgi:hypothetical protein
MKKISLEEAIAKVNDNFSSVFTKEDVISLLSGIKPESKLTPELSEQIQNKIERCLDNNSSELIDTDQISFEINYSNTIEANDIYLDVRGIMNTIDDIMSEFVEEPILEEEEVFSSEFTSVEDDVVELEKGTINNEETDEDSGVTVY